MCPVSHRSFTFGVMGFGSVSIHFAARRAVHFPDPDSGLPVVGLPLGLNSPCAWNRELPNGFHPGSADRILDAEDQDDGWRSTPGDG
jgi:hypothetical protein